MQLPRKRKMLFYVMPAVAVLAVVAYGPVLDWKFQSFQVGNRQAALVTAWRLGRARSRALVLVPTNSSQAHRVSNSGLMLNIRGIHLKGRRIKAWRKNFVALLHEGPDGKWMLDEVACDERRLQWLISDDPKSDAAEIRRLDADCEQLESPPVADVKSQSEVGKD